MPSGGRLDGAMSACNWWRCADCDRNTLAVNVAGDVERAGRRGIWGVAAAIGGAGVGDGVGVGVAAIGRIGGGVARWPLTWMVATATVARVAGGGVVCGAGRLADAGTIVGRRCTGGGAAEETGRLGGWFLNVMARGGPGYLRTDGRSADGRNTPGHDG